MIILISSIFVPSVNCKKTSLSITKDNKNYDFLNKTKKNINITLTLKDADLILKKFFDIEQNYTGAYKIKKQVDTLKEIGVFSNDNFIRTFLQFIDNTNYSCGRGFLRKGVFVGPTLISHFTPFGYITGGNLFNKCWFNYSFKNNLSYFLNNTVIHGFIGALPYYIGFSFTPVFITAVSMSTSGFYSKIFFPFFELMLPCFGFSIRIKIDDGVKNPKTFFEYNLDFCLFGILRGINF